MGKQLHIMIANQIGRLFPAHVKDELGELQNIVGGYIEIAAYLPDGVICVADEEAILKRRPASCVLTDRRGNIVTVFGQCFFCGTDGEKFASLTARQEATVRKSLLYYTEALPNKTGTQSVQGRVPRGPRHAKGE